MKYLAIPYTGIEEESYRIATKVLADLTRAGEIVFSPITHCHPMALAHDLPGDWAFWERIDREFISKCDELIVICIPGWLESTGVQAEIAMARDMGIPIREMQYNQEVTQ